MTTGPRRFALRLRGSELLLPPGRLVLGRSASCHIVLDDAMASRRHAVLTVTPEGATIEDLNSINGVCVNDERLGRGPRAVDQGDRLLLGSTELELVTLAVLPRPELAHADTLSGTDPVVPAEGDEDLEDELPETQRVDALELLGTALDRAYTAGRADLAERLLADHLRDVLHDARAGRAQSPATLELAVEHAVRLAREARRGAWFDYAIELLSARRLPPSLGALASMASALVHLDHVNVDLFRDYLLILRAEAPRLDAEQMRVLGLTEDLYAKLETEALSR
jgi:pSer/pThr/pTyr-binding forkhead associated (FHA) protein